MTKKDDFEQQPKLMRSEESIPHIPQLAVNMTEVVNINAEECESKEQGSDGEDAGIAGSLEN